MTLHMTAADARQMARAVCALAMDEAGCLRKGISHEATCMTAIRHGFTSVMMGGSLMGDAKTPARYDYNVDITERVARMAHWVGASVEVELGVLGSLETGEGAAEDGHGAEGKLDHAMLLTDPDQAVDDMAKRHASGTLSRATLSAKAA